MLLVTLLKKLQDHLDHHITLRNRLNKLNNRPAPKNENNNLSQPQSPPPRSPLQPPSSFSQKGPSPSLLFVSPPSQRFLESFRTPQTSPGEINLIPIPPAPSAPPLTPEDYHNF